MTNISIVVPIHNEEENIEELIDRITKVMSLNYENDWELILVNDASTDKSYEILKQIKDTRIKILNLEKRSGQAGCYQVAFKKTQGDYVIRMDGDLQDSPEDLPLMIEKIKIGYDAVCGIREARKHSLWIRLPSMVYNILVLLIFNIYLHEASASFVAFKSKYIKNLNLRKNDNRYLIPIINSRGGNNIGEVVVHHNKRKSGKSKYSAFSKYIKGIPQLILVWYRIKSGKYRLIN